MAGRFSQQFSNQLGSMMQFSLPRGQRELTPEEIAEIEARTEKERAQTGKYQTETQKVQEETRREKEAYETRRKGGEGYVSALRDEANIPLVLSPIERARQEREIDYQKYLRFRDMVPDTQLTFDEFVAKKPKAQLDVKAKEADLAKTEAETRKLSTGDGKPRPFSEITLRGTGAFSAQKYKDWYDKQNEADKYSLPSPNLPPEEITKALESAKSGAKAGMTFGADVSKAIGESAITGTKALQAEIEGESITKQKNKKYPAMLPDAYKDSFKEWKDEYKQVKSVYKEQIDQSTKMQSLLGQFIKRDKDGKITSTVDATGQYANALIASFAKVLDPRSTMRESEAAAISEASNGATQKIENAIQRVYNGQILPADAVKEMNGVVETYRQWANDNLQNAINEYGQIAEDYEQDPIHLIGADVKKYKKKPAGKAVGSVTQEGE